MYICMYKHLTFKMWMDSDLLWAGGWCGGQNTEILKKINFKPLTLSTQNDKLIIQM